jgi:hypothetical protein
MARGGRCSRSELQEQAAKIVALIEKFNSALVDLHDTIFPPPGAPRAVI